jgi:parallel beta-helix repeat protein
VRKPVIILLCMAMLFSTTYLAADTSNDIAGRPVSSDKTAYNVSTPFRINSNAQFATMAAAREWPGDGSQGSPYIIDNYDINGSGYGSCIYVGNTTCYFTIRNCYLHHANGNNGTYFGNSGILLYYAQNGNIANNTVSYNSCSICLSSSSSNNTVTNNTVLNVGGRISINGNYNIIANCTVSSNSDDGISLGGNHNTIFNNTVNGNDGGLTITGNNNNISYNNASSNFEGIRVFGDNNSIINNNASSNNCRGIRLGGNYNIIANCTVSSNGDSYSYIGIYLQYSNNIIVANNTILDNYILLSGCINNVIINNTMTKLTICAGVYIDGSVLEHFNTNSIDTSNTVNSKPIYYWKNQTGGTVPSGASQVILANCTGVVVENNNFNDVPVGVELGFSSNNIIANNTVMGLWGLNGVFLEYSNNNTVINNYISDKGEGIYLVTSNGNTINGNTASNNYNGIWLCASSYYNTIINNIVSNSGWDGIYINWNYYTIAYHNNLINNNHQVSDNGINAWNASYPLGGNYWSGYSGIDLKSGPLQDQPGPDGIGDTPIIIDANSQDYYPLMSPIQLNQTNVTYFRIPVVPGWNLISTSLIPNNTTLPTPLLDLDRDTFWVRAQYYNASDAIDQWKQWYFGWPTSLNDLTNIDHKKGAWLYVTALGDGYINVSGTIPTSTTIPLYAGWNLVGYPTLNTTTTVANALWGTGADRVEVCDPTAPYRTKEVGPTYVMKPGEGYWIHVPADTVWVVNW